MSGPAPVVVWVKGKEGDATDWGNKVPLGGVGKGGSKRVEGGATEGESGVHALHVQHLSRQSEEIQSEPELLGLAYQRTRCTATR